MTQWQEKAMSGLGSDKSLSFPEEEQTLVEMKAFARGEGKTWTSRASRIHHSFILWSLPNERPTYKIPEIDALPLMICKIVSLAFFLSVS